MDNTFPTMRPVAEHKYEISKWVVEELENARGWHFETPRHYVFGFNEIDNALNFIVHGAAGGIILDTMYGDKHYVRDGAIVAFQPDSWINKGFRHGEDVATLHDLAEVVLTFVSTKWIHQMIS